MACCDRLSYVTNFYFPKVDPTRIVCFTWFIGLLKPFTLHRRWRCEKGDNMILRIHYNVERLQGMSKYKCTIYTYPITNYLTLAIAELSANIITNIYFESSNSRIWDSPTHNENTKGKNNKHRERKTSAAKKKTLYAPDKRLFKRVNFAFIKFNIRYSPCSLSTT